MTTSSHAALFRFSFTSEGSGSPVVFLDLTDLSNSRMDNASISVDPDSGRMMGESRFKPSFGEGDYVAYFCADFQGPSIRDNGIFVDSRGSADVKEVKISRGINGAPPPAGAFNRFTSKDAVLARVGLSFISAEQACSLAEEEIPSFDFQGTRDFAEESWKAKMGGISVSSSADSATSGTGMMGWNGTATGNRTGTAMSQKEEEDMLKNFYSGIYRTMINPQNYTGVVPVVDAETIYFDSFYWFVPLSPFPLHPLADMNPLSQHLGPLPLPTLLPHHLRHPRRGRHVAGFAHFV